MYEDYFQNMFGNDYYPYNTTYTPSTNNHGYFNNLEDLYPEIYSIVYPMVQKVCTLNTMPICENLIENLTNDVYINFEEQSKNESRETRQDNTLLKDLIKILLIRELIGTSHNHRPQRPIPPPLPRPFMPGNPPPPLRPRY